MLMLKNSLHILVLADEESVEMAKTVVSHFSIIIVAKIEFCTNSS